MTSRTICSHFVLVVNKGCRHAQRRSAAIKSCNNLFAPPIAASDQATCGQADRAAVLPNDLVHRRNVCRSSPKASRNPRGVQLLRTRNYLCSFDNCDRTVRSLDAIDGHPQLNMTEPFGQKFVETSKCPNTENRPSRHLREIQRGSGWTFQLAQPPTHGQPS